MTARLQELDYALYLPDDILTKVDRASMAVSLEARVPLLDHRVVEFAWKTPMSLKYRNGMGKWLLREVLYRYVPRKLMDSSRLQNLGWKPKFDLKLGIENTYNWFKAHQDNYKSIKM